ncbi:MAG: DUF962 domain-containing protein [Myxococcales bacterium]|nr:DUF962 domain-containing protein [Myxococcales bacterium]MCA9696574.1 DUF962 domain-containing protein [Myxococcales bacterium]
MAEEFSDFESFWPHFLSSHMRAATRWAHVAALAVGVLGLIATIVLRHWLPLVLGAAGTAALAVGAHPLFEGNRAENLGRPLWGARGFWRLCVRTIAGSIEAEVAALARTRE